MSGTQKWMDLLKAAEKTCLISDGRRKIHYTFSDKTEMAEEYALQTGEVIVRKWRKKSTLGAQLPWEFEIGQLEAGLKVNIAEDMAESTSNPIFVRQDTLQAFQWRIRNLFYPASNFKVELNEKDRVIIVKTENKKYYKKFNIQDLDRIGFNLDKNNLSHTFANNTLIITYAKPKEFIVMENIIKAELAKTKASKDGDVANLNDCKTS